jgi:peptide deformylase
MATKEQIITLPNLHLYSKSKKIKTLSDEVMKVIEDMKSATLDWENSREHEVGVALAAIQINQPYRIIVVRNNFDDKEDHTFSTFINPEIIKKEGEIEEDFEGCLSVKNIYGKVPRHSKVKIKALDETGREVRVKAEGFLARVFQHEVDHTNGIMFIDHIRDNKEAFYQLTPDGKLDKLEYDDVKATDIFRD